MKRLSKSVRAFYNDHRQIIRYLLFGIFTTVASLASYFLTLYLGEALLSLDTEDPEFYIVRIVAQVIQWIAGVIVAFFTNKKWVFDAGDLKGKAEFKAFVMFAGSRFLTFWVDTALTLLTVWLLQDVLSYVPFRFIIEITSDVWAKIVANIVVVATNYIISKYIVFRKIRNCSGKA